LLSLVFSIVFLLNSIFHVCAKSTRFRHTLQFPNQYFFHKLLQEFRGSDRPTGAIADVFHIDNHEEEASMQGAYNGKFLRVDLTQGTTQVEEVPVLTYRMYLGGSAMAAAAVNALLRMAAEQRVKSTQR
jgi:hypothetical protein